MKELQEYVIAENARLLGEKSLSESLQGIFIGTKKYFFFVPVNTTEDIRKTRKGKPVAPTFFFKGKPTSEFIQEFLNRRGVTTAEFEEFLRKKVQKEIPESLCCAIDDVEQFKIYSTWWGSGILINSTEGKAGWKPLLSRFKGAKKKIKGFYQGHPKLVR
ncbi:MAG: hypothetical protein GQ574_15165 [Crocinitomix sp.]|nr:hypothetical protein [Crocinitomix sp.]